MTAGNQYGRKTALISEKLIGETSRNELSVARGPVRAS